MHMGSIVTDIDFTGLAVRDHEGATTHYDAGTVLWTAGVEAPAFAAGLAKATGAERDRAGRILVQPDLTIACHPEISVIGDLMSLDKLPGVAEVAMQGGLYAGHRDPALAAGRRTAKPFRYATWARPPTSPAATPSCRPGRCRSAGSPAGSAGCSSTSPS